MTYSNWSLLAKAMTVNDTVVAVAKKSIKHMKSDMHGHNAALDICFFTNQPI